jgi:hypothetical protein
MVLWEEQRTDSYYSGLWEHWRTGVRYGASHQPAPKRGNDKEATRVLVLMDAEEETLIRQTSLRSVSTLAWAALQSPACPPF